MEVYGDDGWARPVRAGGRRLAPRSTQRHAPVRAQVSAPGVVVGIDLGTTSSAIAIVAADGKAEILSDEQGHGTMPSRVFFPDDDGLEPLVGSDAGDDAAASSKRVVGRSYEDAKQATAARLFFGESLVCMENGSAGLRCGNAVVTPEDVACEILMELLARAEAHCGVRAERACIGVPAHFTDSQREATKAAAERAGLSRVRLLEEPVAAALAYSQAPQPTPF